MLSAVLLSIFRNANDDRFVFVGSPKMENPIELAGVVQSAITPREFTTLSEQSGVDDCFVTGRDVGRVRVNAGHDLAPNSWVERAEEEQFVLQSRHITTHVRTGIVVIFMEQISLLVDASVVSLT